MEACLFPSFVTIISHFDEITFDLKLLYIIEEISLKRGIFSSSFFVYA